MPLFDVTVRLLLRWCRRSVTHQFGHSPRETICGHITLEVSFIGQAWPILLWPTQLSLHGLHLLQSIGTSTHRKAALFAHFIVNDSPSVVSCWCVHRLYTPSTPTMGMNKQKLLLQETSPPIKTDRHRSTSVRWIIDCLHIRHIYLCNIILQPHCATWTFTK